MDAMDIKLLEPGLITLGVCFAILFLKIFLQCYDSRQAKAEKNNNKLTDIKIIKDQDNVLTNIKIIKDQDKLTDIKIIKDQDKLTDIKIIKDQDNVLAEQSKEDLKPVDELLSNDGKPCVELLVKKNTKCKDLHPILLGRAG